MLKVAISTDNGQVSAHFGRCPSFTIVDIEDGQITNTQTVDNPGHEPGRIPEFLNEKGVECIVSGGMGMKATTLFNGYGIETIVGIQGDINDILKNLQAGTLQGGESLCKPGVGKGYGIDKTECDHDEEH